MNFLIIFDIIIITFRNLAYFMRNIIARSILNIKSCGLNNSLLTKRQSACDASENLIFPKVSKSGTTSESGTFVRAI